MGSTFLKYFRKWNTFWSGHSPSHFHNTIRDKILALNNKGILFLFYFIILTPISFALRLLGQSFLSLKKSKKSTYWINKKVKINYERMY